VNSQPAAGLSDHAALKANVLLANLVNACFGGSSEPWTKQFPPNSYTCGYVDNFYYVSNFYNGVVAERSGGQRRPAQPGIRKLLHPGVRRHQLVRACRIPLTPISQLNISL
jgi:hypothetical protein